MKTAAIASLLFAGAALAAPLNEKRGVHTEVVVTTVWTTTTLYIDAPTRGVFAESASKSASSSSSTSSSIAPPPASSAAAPVVPSVAAAAVVVPSTAAVVAPAAVTSAAAVAAAPASTGSGPSGTGDVTWYEVAGNAGSCGMSKGDSDYVVALSIPKMNNPANPNSNPLCGKFINIQGETKVFQAMIYDTCEGCSTDSIDLSPQLFKDAFPGGNGRVHNVQWYS